MIKKALCIGNATYPEDALINPTHDATDVADKLKSLGFQCNVLTDATIVKMQEALKLLSDALMDADIGLFFFAGHGMQIDGENYLTAVDTDFDKELDAKYSSLPLNKVIDVLEKGENDTSIIVLDACRNNPYERRWRGIGSRGLAPVYAPKGTIIAYATSPGQVALDGSGRNGAFTASLLKHISTHNVTIEDLFKRVRNSLSAATSGKQISWEHTSLMGDFIFNQAIVTDEYIAEYSHAALADATYRVPGTSPLLETINQLKSHDWYVQNPAVAMLKTIDLATATKDDLFVLGRNLYQTACGGSNNGAQYLEDLANNLGTFEPEAAFHILNGMLYEIYFDSHDRLRQRKKTGRLDDVLALDDMPQFSKSFDFIRQALRQHEKTLFYIPGSQREVVTDINNTAQSDNNTEVKGINVDGQDVFYAADGETLISNATIPFQYSQSLNEFEAKLAGSMVVPSSRLIIKYAYPVDANTSVIVPYDYKIQKVTK